MAALLCCASTLVGTALLGSAAPAVAATPPTTPPTTVSPATGLPITSFWLAAASGEVWALGGAPSLGSVAAPARPLVTIATTPTAKGYWLTGADGGVFSFGDANFYGSTGAIKLNQPIVGMASTPDGKGYWLLASDGGVFSFGNANFYGSTGAINLNQPIIGLTSAPNGKGYWLLAADGGVFSFGGAPFAGSRAGMASADRAQRLVANKTGGYWIFGDTGTAFAYGNPQGTPPTVGLLFPASTPGQRAVTFALRELGKPYIWGGNGPVGYDCSGLALAAWKTTGRAAFARVANDQYHTVGASVPLYDLEAGDLVFWGDNREDWASVYHTAIYIGGGRIVESTGDHVQVNSLGQWGYRDLMPFGRRP